MTVESKVYHYAYSDVLAAMIPSTTLPVSDVVSSMICEPIHEHVNDAISHDIHVAILADARSYAIHNEVFL